MNTPYNKDFQIDFNQIVSEIAANWWTDTWNQIIDVQKAYKYHEKIIAPPGKWPQTTCVEGYLGLFGFGQTLHWIMLFSKLCNNNSMV